MGRILLCASTTSRHEERDTRTDLCTSENIFRGLRPSARHGSPLDKRGRKAAAREPPKTMLKCFGSLSQTVERKRVTAQPRDGEDEEAAGGEGEAAVGRTGADGTPLPLPLFSDATLVTPHGEQYTTYPYHRDGKETSNGMAETSCKNS